MMKQRSRLLQAIEESKKSYVELEKETGIAKSSIQRYATGKTKKIPIDVIELIAKATNTSASWIIGWNEQKKNDTTPSIILQKSDAIADIILRLRSDDKFRELVDTLCKLSDEQFAVVETMLSAFKQQNMD